MAPDRARGDGGAVSKLRSFRRRCRFGRVLGIGDDYDGLEVTGLALNPVSLSETGFAVRLELNDGSGRIAHFLRLDNQ